MSADTPARLALLRELRDEILLHYGSGRPIVAVDGLPGSGAAAVADALAATFADRDHAVVRASIDDFPRGGETAPAEGESFRDALATPFRRSSAEGFRLAPGAEQTTTDADAVLIVDGLFLLQPGLIGLWNYSVFVEVPREIAAERAGSAAVPSEEDQRAYLGSVRPRTRAVAIVDNTDADAPVRRFADSC